jgi:glycosyltransferase involved in cell wall biosynthesis
MGTEGDRTGATTPELLVVIPVYNEEASIGRVVVEWFQVLEGSVKRFSLLAIDDGSTDRTPKLLHELRELLGPQLEILSRPNRGHGQTCLQGYRIAVERGIPYVFQIDSDGQCPPQYFGEFWRNRYQCDVIYGRRTRRDDGLRRTLVSKVVRLLLFLRFGTNCVDPNVPYRLMRTAAIAPVLKKVPSSFSLANIALAVLLRQTRSISHGAIPIHFGERYGGEPTVPLGKFGTEALKLYRQMSEMLNPHRAHRRGNAHG